MLHEEENERNSDSGRDLVESMYKTWYLDYASYVILDRAVPHALDGLKPVQRRILHSLKELDDGRFHKVANVIGHAMKYHPHGDAAIYDALVNLGQKNILIETQGNWGNPATGDRAAAARYIEARLSKFAQEVVFNPEITEWQASYDGRSKEPVFFPVRFPLLLAQGVDGIAVGLATKILPHNFCELLEASIDILRGKKVKIYPDFPSGGLADVSEYHDGKKGSRVKVRANVSVLDKKTIKIDEIPYGTTTGSLIDSIVNATEKGKLKIRKVEDNTARDVEILIHLNSNSGTPQETIDALYAFTECEVSLSPNCCVITEHAPEFVGVNDLLHSNTQHTKELLRLDLENRLKNKQNKLHFATVEKIFISKRVYRVIEDCETWEDILSEIAARLKPYEKLFVHPVSAHDVEKLTEIKVKRISRFDSKKADDEIEKLELEIKEIQLHLNKIVDYTISYFQKLLKDYGQHYKRQTKLESFAAVAKSALSLPSKKLYVNFQDGFIGTGLKKDQFLFEVTDIDEVIVFTEEGKFTVVQPEEKTFIGKDIIHVQKFSRGDERCIYHLIYRDGKTGPAYAKRFNTPSITRNKAYDLTRGKPGSKVIYMSAHPQGEAERVMIYIHPNSKAKKKQFAFDFSEMPVKNRSTLGDKISDYPLQKVEQIELGATTLAAQKIWFDETSHKLVNVETEKYIGEFTTGDLVLLVYQSGAYEVTELKVNSVYASDLMQIYKLDSERILSIVYFDGEREAYYVKRFSVPAEVTSERVVFMALGAENRVCEVTAEDSPKLTYTLARASAGGQGEQSLDVAEFVEVRKVAALGNKITDKKLKNIGFL